MPQQGYLRNVYLCKITHCHFNWEYYILVDEMYLLFDIGGTNMRVTASSDGKTFVDPQIVTTPSKFNDGMATLKKLAYQLAPQGGFEGIAAGVAGVLDSSKSFLAVAPHIPDWAGKPLKQVFTDNFNAPVILENDAAFAALGEANFGAGMGYRIVAFLTISTGVGGARVVDGKLDVSSSGFEPGHQMITFGGNVCPGCTALGHLEGYVSGSAIENIYHTQPEQIKDPATWEGVARWLAVGLNNTSVYWSPDIIVLGGSMMKSIPIERVQFYFKQALNIFVTPPQVVLGKLSDMAGLYGAMIYLDQVKTQL